jgi:sphingolipid 4-desaturase/C4-monooxygenase
MGKRSNRYFGKFSLCYAYGLKHHAFQGVHELDADLPDWYEARLINNYSIGKAVWLLFFPVFQVIRTARCKELFMFDKHVIMNIICQVAFDILIIYFWGWEQWHISF